jgi:alpha-galactosidase
MKNLYKLLDVFEANGVKVDLSWYGCRTTFDSLDGKYDGSWLGGSYGQNGINSWMVAPTLTDNPTAEYAESVAACLKYLFEKKQYTCINEISIFPEPEGVLQSTDPTQLVNIINLVKAKLTEYGIRDRVVISGPADYNNNSEMYDQRYLSTKVFEKATSSVYPFGVDTPHAVMLDFAKGYVEVCEKYNISWGVAECGTYNFLTAVTNKDAETYDRALFMAKFFTNMVNGGCTNIKYFVFSDCYYDSSLNQLGLFKFRHENFKAKPVWYTWSLICKYTDIGSEVYPVTVDYKPKNADDNMAITALKLPDGSWTYVAVNDSDETKKIAIVNGKVDRPEEMNVYRVSGSSIPESGELKTIQSNATVNGKSGVVYLTVPANGYVLVSNK